MGKTTCAHTQRCHPDPTSDASIQKVLLSAQFHPARRGMALTHDRIPIRAAKMAGHSLGARAASGARVRMLKDMGVGTVQCMRFGLERR